MRMQPVACRVCIRQDRTVTILGYVDHDGVGARFRELLKVPRPDMPFGLLGSRMASTDWKRGGIQVNCRGCGRTLRERAENLLRLPSLGGMIWA